MVDVAPSLFEKVNAEFKRLIKANKKIKDFNKKLRNKTFTMDDANIYAVEVGDALAKSFNKIKAEDLPDGKMYYNIADRVVRPNMEENYVIVSDMAEQAQRITIENAGLGLNPVKPELDNNRIQGILDKVTGSDNFGLVSWVLGEPIRNFSQNIVDESIYRNAYRQAQVGLNPKIVRKAEPGGVRAVKRGNKVYQYVVPCRWCRALEGTYDYYEVIHGSDIWRRHENCRCIVTYQVGKEVQNVYTKKFYNSEAEAAKDVRIATAKNFERRNDPNKLGEIANNYDLEKASSKKKQDLREIGYEWTRERARTTPKATLIREMADHAEKMEYLESKLKDPTATIPNFYEKNPRKRQETIQRWNRELRYAKEDLKIKYEVFEELYG